MPTSSTLAADVAHQRTCQASQLITESLSYAGPMNYDGTGIFAQRFEPPGELCKAGSGSGSRELGPEPNRTAPQIIPDPPIFRLSIRLEY